MNLKTKVGLGFLLALYLASVGMAQDTTQYLPQLADGGGWLTTFVIINQAASPINVTIDLFAPNGAPLPVLGTGVSSSSFSLLVGGSVQVRTLGSAGPTT